MSEKKDQPIHEQFIIALEDQGLTVHTANHFSSLFAGDKDLAAAIRALGSKQRNIYFLAYKGKIGIIHLHIRSKDSGFWGLTKNTLDQVKVFKEALKIPNWLILLVGRQDQFIADGYIISDVGKHPMTRPINLLATGGYRINEQQDLDCGKKIRSIGLIAKKLGNMMLAQAVN